MMFAPKLRGRGDEVFQAILRICFCRWSTHK
jgi:hypothetical protein